MAKKNKTEQKMNAELKIRQVAQQLFTEKGFDAVTTREIAEQAGINLALLNYYFRSKQKLYEMIMHDNMLQFKQGIVEIMGNKTDDVFVKIEKLAELYIDAFIADKNLALFIANTVNSKADNILATDTKGGMDESRKYFAQQIAAYCAKHKRKPLHPAHVISSILGLIMFPFLMRPLVMRRIQLDDKEFEQLMLERKTLIPQWIKLILDAK